MQTTKRPRRNHKTTITVDRAAAGQLGAALRYEAGYQKKMRFLQAIFIIVVTAGFWFGGGI